MGNVHGQSVREVEGQCRVDPSKSRDLGGSEETTSVDGSWTREVGGRSGRGLWVGVDPGVEGWFRESDPEEADGTPRTSLY